MDGEYQQTRTWCHSTSNDESTQKGEFTNSWMAIDGNNITFFHTN